MAKNRRREMGMKSTALGKKAELVSRSHMKIPAGIAGIRPTTGQMEGHFKTHDGQGAHAPKPYNVRPDRFRAYTTSRAVTVLL